MQRNLTALLLVVLTVPCAAQFDIPGPGDINIKIKIPGLSKILRAEPALGTSIEDALTGVAFLDDYEPAALIPMVEAPRVSGAGFALAPGAWQASMESYCLHAGVHGPSSGEGYLWAPLKGPLADEINDIMVNAAYHPEVPQQDIQLLVWGLLAHTKISAMSDELRQAARALLTVKQIRRLNGGALARIPERLFDRAFGELPPAVRDVMEAEARIRNMMAGQIADFDAIEHIAVVPGDPPFDPNAPYLPRGRWSYVPGGFFARFLPDGYKRTDTTVVVPAEITFEQDALGRFTILEDQAGNRVEASYNDAIAPATVAGDIGVLGYAFESLQLSAPDSAAPGGVREMTLTGVGWALVGTASGAGQAQAGPAPYTDLVERYAWAVEHSAQLAELVAGVKQAGEAPASDADTAAAVTLMANLANFHQALQRATASDNGEPWLHAPVELPRQAWMATLASVADGLDAPMTSQASIEARQPVRLASALLSPTLFAGIGMQAHGRRGGGLPIFKPGGGAAQPTGGRQRLGQSHRPLRDFVPDDDDDDDDDDGNGDDNNGKVILEKAKKAIGWIGKGKQVVDAVTNPVGTIAGQVGFGIQGQMQSGYFDWLFGTASKISKQLGGDPPRADFDIIEPMPHVAAGSPQDFGEVPAARAAALNDLRFAMDNLVATSRVAKISLDRLGGAMEAGNAEWEQNQAMAFMEQKRTTGVWFTETARCLDALLDELGAEGIIDIQITPEAYAAYQARLRATGFTAEELQAARMAGLTNAEIAAELQLRLALNPAREAGSLMQRGRRAAEVMRALGARWQSLPANDLGL
jgi:hypothetical protein